MIKTEQSSYSDQQNCLISIISCLICQQVPSQAHICPNCSKFFCFGCIRIWISQMTENCPYCKQKLEEKQLVNCQKLCSELSMAFENVKHKKDQKKAQKVCKTHQRQLNYYCHDCQKQVCEKCCIQDIKHQGHKFMKYHESKRQFQREISEIKTRINDTKIKTQQLLRFRNDKRVNFINQNIEKDSKKLAQFVKNLRQKTSKKFNTQIRSLEKIKDFERKTIEQKNEIYEKSLQFIKNCPKVQFVAHEAQALEQKLESHLTGIKTSNLSMKKIVEESKSRVYQSEVLPSYHQKTFTLKNFGNLCYLNEIIYTDVLTFKGLQWRLKIYPAGNHGQNEAQREENFYSSKNIFEESMSVFVELKSSIRQSGKFRHKVSIQHPKIQNKTFYREFQSIFERGESWGYDKFVKVGQLYDHKFIDDKNDELQITLLIAPANYFEANQNAKAYISERRAHLKCLRQENQDVNFVQQQIQKVEQQIELNNE